MKKKQSLLKRAVVAFLAVAVAFTFAFTPLSWAEEGNTNGFTMSPMYEKAVINPGESYTSSFKIRNPASANTPFYYKVFLQPYYRDEQNNAIFEDVDGMSQIVEWTKIKSPEKGVLQPGEATMVEFSIDVPETAPAGGQYMAVTVSSDSSATDSTGNGIMIKESVAMGYTVYAEITGTTIHQGEITEANLPSFLLSGEIAGSSIVKNTGNTHGTASYKLQIFPLFSDEEVYTTEEDPDERLVLPNRALYAETHWPGTPSIGIFKARYTVQFEGIEKVVEKLVIICPIWTLFVIIMSLALLITWLIVRARSHKKAGKNAEKSVDTE